MNLQLKTKTQLYNSIFIVVIAWLGDCKIELNRSCDLRVIVVRVVSNRTNTVKQGILYWTCTGLAVEVIGLAPTHD